jgi:hypothetical protein
VPPGIVGGDVSQRVDQDDNGAVTAVLSCTLSGGFVVAAGDESSDAQNALWRTIQ